ncbi:NfeD family protein [Faunimonas sp. B44]|uniref:NfeD family protein n=1 Tax=Faunimonas sp. B44 TaxID=3461493 RepID=UPI00404488D7
MIATIVEALGGWAWWVLGLVLLGVEILAPGFLFLWFGIAAILIGIGSLLFAWPWQVQVIGFAVLSVVTAVLGRRLMGSLSTSSDAAPHLNEPAMRYVGRSFVLTEPVANGAGRVRADDSVWRIEGPDSPAGARIRIVGARGTTLLFEPAPEASGVAGGG